MAFTVTFRDGTRTTYPNDPNDRNEFTIEANGVLVVTSWSTSADPNAEQSPRKRVRFSPHAWATVEDVMERNRPPERPHW